MRERNEEVASVRATIESVKNLLALLETGKRIKESIVNNTVTKSMVSMAVATIAEIGKNGIMPILYGDEAYALPPAVTSTNAYQNIQYAQATLENMWNECRHGMFFSTDNWKLHTDCVIEIIGTLLDTEQSAFYILELCEKLLRETESDRWDLIELEHGKRITSQIARESASNKPSKGIKLDANNVRRSALEKAKYEFDYDIEETLIEFGVILDDRIRTNDITAIAIPTEEYEDHIYVCIDENPDDIFSRYTRIDIENDEDWI